MEKTYISASELLRDSFLLGRQIIETEFRPDFIVGVWRGGTPVGIAVQELLDYAGIVTDHVAIRTSYYRGIADTADSVQVHGLGYLIRKLNRENKLLIVDDVLDSGRSIEAIIDELKSRCRRNLPEDLRVATVWYKPAKSETGRVPDFYVHETDQWLVFPHELQGLTVDEVQTGK
ncbi:MAG TPA: hypoxanthine phosphoribosyltransferase, partial [Gammaproteobacteria bacterium]|nr:hypoxanthine phosphoribosyltransferase [Gammaproteobacteria bacterium]